MGRPWLPLPAQLHACNSNLPCGYWAYDDAQPWSRCTRACGGGGNQTRPIRCVLARGDCTLSDFTDEKVWGDDVRGLFPIIHRHPVDKLEGEFPTEVHITLKDGRQFTSIHEWPKGSKAAPFTWAEYWGKFDGCCIGVLEGAELATLRDLSQRLPDLADAGDLMRAAAFTPVS